MPADTQQILDAAEKIGQMLADHPAVTRYQQAQKAVSDDPDAGRLLGDFERQLEGLARQEAGGMPVSDAQRQQLQTLQSRIMSHIKIKNLNMAQVEFVDLLRRINQTIQRPLQPPAPTGAPGASRGPAIG